MFNITTTDLSTDFFGEPAIPSSIIIDDFKEEFFLPTTYWNLNDYKRSWVKSIEEGLHKKNHSALAVSMYDPNKANFIFVWIIYFKGKDVFIQNQTLFMDDCPGFEPNRINSFIEPRYTETEDGNKISEWRTDLNSIFAFHQKLKMEI
ncbi:hypothetical protein [Xenorhabdus entomophaga]|uniref:hypothetical protein n=1 Tax=Xenorhabdus entomophaga TaxID=3136257 RepID=UPI0030F4018E